MQEIFVVTFTFPHGKIPFHFSTREIAEKFLDIFYSMGKDKYIIDYEKLDMSFDKHNLYTSMEDIQNSILEQLQNKEAIKEIEERLNTFYTKYKEDSK